MCKRMICCGTMTTWTHFWDMCSGGTQKENFAHCFIEAPIAEARTVFYTRFGHNPDCVTCTCCGEDYSTSEGSYLSVTGYHRGLRSLKQKRRKDGRYIPIPSDVDFYLEPGIPVPEGWEADEPDTWRNDNQSVETFEARDDVLIIRASEITDEERSGDVPDQGYIWQD